MYKKINDLLKLIFCFLLFFFIGEIFALILKLFGIDYNNLSNLWMVIYQFLLSLFLFILLFILYKRTIKEDFTDFKKNIKKNIIQIIKMFILFIIVKYIVSFISAFIMILLNFDPSSITSVNQNTIEIYVKSSPILMLLTVSILAPFYEETLFRLGIKKVIKNKYFYIITSGLIFGLLHIFPLEEGISLTLGIIQSISYITMGIFLAHAYYKTNNIFVSIGIHFLNNFLSALVMINMI